MLTTIRCPAGIILASCEWWLVNDLGNQDWARGTVVWVEQVEITQGAMSRQVIHDMIEKIALTVPQATGAYWVRRDKTSYKLHAFRRGQLVRRGNWQAQIAAKEEVVV